MSRKTRPVIPTRRSKVLTLKNPSPGKAPTRRASPPILPSAPAGEGGAPAGPFVVTPPTGLLADATTFNVGQAASILSNSFYGLIPNSEFAMRTILADDIYLYTPVDFVLDSINTDPILSTKEHYVPEIFDCDDYVQMLKTKMSLYAASNHVPAPLAVGYLLTSLHAFSFCISQGSILTLINTQSDTHATTSDRSAFRGFLSLGVIIPNTNQPNIIQTVYL